MALSATPVFTDAAEIKQTYEDYRQTIIYRPACDPIKGVATEEDCFYKAPKRTYLATNTQKCSCVTYLNAYYGTNIRTVDGYARSIVVKSKLPSTTGFVVTYESGAGHIAHYYSDGDYIVLDAEWNYQHFVAGDCPMTSGRRIKADSLIIKGYL